MRILNADLLQEFRESRRCEWCGRSTPGGCDPHHIFTRGAGGSDLRINLISLCRECHTRVDHGAMTQFDLITVVSAREKVLQDSIIDVIHLIRRLPKDARTAHIEAALEELDGTARNLARSILIQAEKLQAA